MLTAILIVFVVGTTAFYDKNCCCGCDYPCPVTIPARCGAPPTTQCAARFLFNSSELLSPCDLIIKIHELTSGVIRDSPEEHEHQPVPIDQSTTPPTTTKLPASVQPTSHKKEYQSFFSRLFSMFPRFQTDDVRRTQPKTGEKTSETVFPNGTVIKETVRNLPTGTEVTRVVLSNETDPVKAKQKWQEMIAKVRQGIGRMDEGVTTMQHGVVDSFDSLFKGIVDGVFTFLHAAR